MRPCANAWRGCEGEATAKREECVNCRATAARWSKRKTSDIVRRHRNLTLWDHRLTPLLPDDADEKMGMSPQPPRSNGKNGSKVTTLPVPHKSFQPTRKRA
jgi:hypothetical protein